MKKFFKYLIPCMAVALSLTSCNETMDDKAVIDSRYETLDNPTVALASAEAIDYENAILTGTILSTENAQEVGFQLSTDAQFSDVTVYLADEVATTFTAEVSGLTEKTTYYVRSYVFTKTGITIVSEASSFTTPKAPYYNVNGTYTVVDYDAKTGAVASDPYTMSVTFADGSNTEVEIYNLWDGGYTIVGEWDAEKSTITVPTDQLIYVHPTYGDVWASGINSSISAYTDYITFTFTTLGGVMQSSFWQAYVPAAGGGFGIFYVSMKHNDDN